MIKKFDDQTGEILDDNDRSKENRDFVMLYRKFVSQVAELGMTDVQALRVLLFLIRHMDTKNALVVPMTLMSDMLGITRQTVSTKIKYLQEHGWIQVMRVGRQYVYTINPDVAWTSYADQKQYCRFEANVMLSADDNWELKGKNRVTLRHLDKSVLKALAAQEFDEDCADEKISDYTDGAVRAID